MGLDLNGVWAGDLQSWVRDPHVSRSFPCSLYLGCYCCQGWEWSCFGLGMSMLLGVVVYM